MNYNFSILLLLFIVGCQRIQDKNKMLDEITNSSEGSWVVEPGHEYGLFIITESGCIACNKHYMKFILENVANRRNMYIYSTASGMRLDISPFLSDTINNLKEGKHEILEKYGLNNGSYFVKVSDNYIDTIVKIEAVTLLKSLEYIEGIQYGEY